LWGAYTIRANATLNSNTEVAMFENGTPFHGPQTGFKKHGVVATGLSSLYNNGILRARLTPTHAGKIWRPQRAAAQLAALTLKLLGF
jgi:hypothetical protein